MWNTLARPIIAASLFAMAATAGCSGHFGAQAAFRCPGVKLVERGQYAQAVEYFRTQKDPRSVNRVLICLRLAVAAMAAGDTETAKSELRDATRIIDAFHTNTNMQEWVALFGDETVKVFKGEPYERALAHWYLGLIYYAEGDYDNAGACLRNALFKLKVYDEKNDAQAEDSAESDFGIGWYLLARCRQRMNDAENTTRCFRYAREATGPRYRWTTDEALNAEANVLLIIETGKGPFKLPCGPNSVGAELNPIFAASSLIPTAWVDGQKARDPGQLVNLNQIAARKKWWNLDTIRYVKGFLSSGAAVAALRDCGTLEGAYAEGLATLLSLGLKPDLRYWGLMPEGIFVLPLKLAPGKHTLKIAYFDTRECEEPWHRQEFSTVEVPEGRECVFLIRCGPEVKGGRLLPFGSRTTARGDENHATPLAAHRR